MRTLAKHFVTGLVLACCAVGPAAAQHGRAPGSSAGVSGLDEAAWRSAPSVEELLAEQGRLSEQWRRQLSVLHPRDRSRLASMRQWVALQRDVFDSDPEEDPRYDDVRDLLRDAYEDLYRDHAEALLPLEEMLDRRVDDGIARMRGGKASGAARRAWLPSLSPRVGLAAERSYLGARLRWQGTDNHFVDHLSLLVRQHDDGGSSFSVKFDDGPRFVELGQVRGEDRPADAYTLLVRWVH